jgi:hypothetical protein
MRFYNLQGLLFWDRRVTSLSDRQIRRTAVVPCLTGGSGIVLGRHVAALAESQHWALQGQV